MLILTRRVGESVVIGEDVTVTVLGVKGNQVRIGINAPKTVAVHREEIFERIKKKAPGFVIEIEGQKIKLEHVFSACLWGPERDPGSLEVKIYKRLRQAANKTSVEIDAHGLMAV